MKKKIDLMDMIITIDITDQKADNIIFDKVFSYFKYVDENFSVFKDSSEISKINNGIVKKSNCSKDMKEILLLSEKTKSETSGYFNIETHDGKYDPSGLVKGWAIYNASKIISDNGFKNFCIEAGGDIQAFGISELGENWKVGIDNPFNPGKEIVKVLSISNMGVATSGTYLRGQHIYNPYAKNAKIYDIVSLTVIGPNIYEADRFATAAFAMGKDGINFIEKLPNFEAYMINKDGIATMTSGFDKFIKNNA